MVLLNPVPNPETLTQPVLVGDKESAPPALAVTACQTPRLGRRHISQLWGEMQGW